MPPAGGHYYYYHYYYHYYDHDCHYSYIWYHYDCYYYYYYYYYYHELIIIIIIITYKGSRPAGLPPRSSALGGSVQRRACDVALCEDQGPTSKVHTPQGDRLIRDKELYTATNKCLQCLIKIMHTVFKTIGVYVWILAVELSLPGSSIASMLPHLLAWSPCWRHSHRPLGAAYALECIDMVYMS